MGRFLGLVVFALSSSPALALRVAIDPGHGGRDAGACHGDIQEAELVLRVARELQVKLSRQAGIDSVLTRGDDNYLSIQARTDLVKDLKADLLVSIHANSSRTPSARGAEIYVRNVLPPDEESQFLANRENQEAGASGDGTGRRRNWLSSAEDLRTIVQDLRRTHALHESARLAERIAETFPRPTRKSKIQIRQAPFFVVSQVDVPAVLVEIGYVTNAEDARWLKASETPTKIAEALATAITSFAAKNTPQL